MKYNTTVDASHPATGQPAYPNHFIGGTQRALRILGFLPPLPRSESDEALDIINYEKTHFRAQNTQLLDPKPINADSKPVPKAVLETRTQAVFPIPPLPQPTSLIKQVSGLGIDTISAFALIEPGTIITEKLKVVQSTNRKENGLLFIDANGERIIGKVAYLKRHGINISLFAPKPYMPNTKVPGTAACQVQLEVAGIAGHGDNTAPADRIATRQVMQRVETILHEIGIKTNFMDFSLVRVDLFRNLELTQPCSTAQSVFDCLFLPWKRKETYAAGNSLDSNRSSAFSIYDKGESHRIKRRSTDHLPEHLLRLEWRLQKSTKTRQMLGIDRVGDLVTKFDSLIELYTQELAKTYFRYGRADFQAGRRWQHNPIKRQIKTIMARIQRQHLAHAVTAKNLLLILNTNGPDDVAAFLKDLPGIDKKWLGTRILAVKDAVRHEAAQRDPGLVTRYFELKAALGITASPSDSQRSRQRVRQVNWIGAV